MIRKSTEILISGGGIAGLTSACAFAKEGFNVVCVDPLLPATNSDDINADLRSTAFLQPAKNTLEKTGVWENFKKYSTPLEVMRLRMLVVLKMKFEQLLILILQKYLTNHLLGTFQIGCLKES